MNQFLTTVAICNGILDICALIALIVKPIRERILGTNTIKDGQRCLLRSDMLHTYYKHNAEDKIRQYEFENFVMAYRAYKALGGNSFIDRIYEEVKTWEVET